MTASNHPVHRCISSVLLFFLLLLTPSECCTSSPRPRSVRRDARDRTAASLLLAAAAAAVGQPLLSPHTAWAAAAASSSTTVVADLRTVEAAADFIATHCTVMLQAARSTGRLLYRGEPAFISAAAQRSQSPAMGGDDATFPAALAALMIKRPLLLSSPPDLLDPATSGAAAADYFLAVSEAMEVAQRRQQQQLPTVYVSPRTGHLATPDPVAASQWGPVASIWPLDPLRYATVGPVEATWWRDDWAQLRGPRGPSFWRDPAALTAFLASQVRVDRGLEGALARGSEVLFLTDTPQPPPPDLPQQPRPRPGTTTPINAANTYLAVPTVLEGRLLALLHVTPFSSTVKTTVQSGGGEVVDDIRRRVDPLEAVPPKLINQAASRVVK